MHPMQTFSGVGVPPLEGKVFAIEGDEIAVRVGTRDRARAERNSGVGIRGRDEAAVSRAGAILRQTPAGAGRGRSADAA